jgi:hypothetical protein
MHLRARLQSACLLSDMESFKAANPGCQLGDFVRWYSPRDWIETEEMGEDGVMMSKGNTTAILMPLSTYLLLSTYQMNLKFSLLYTVIFYYL